MTYYTLSNPQKQNKNPKYNLKFKGLEFSTPLYNVYMS
jgi:hypothetical protein